MSGRYQDTGRYFIPDRPDLLSLSRVQVFGQTVEDAWHFYLFTKTELEEEGSKQRHGQRITLCHNCRRPSPIKPNK